MRLHGVAYAMSCHILQQMGHVHAYATAMAFSLLQVGRVECDELLSFTSAAIVVSEEGKSQLLTVPGCAKDIL